MLTFDGPKRALANARLGVNFVPDMAPEPLFVHLGIVSGDVIFPPSWSGLCRTVLSLESARHQSQTQKSFADYQDIKKSQTRNSPEVISTWLPPKKPNSEPKYTSEWTAFEGK